ncbi:MAG: hypothetical protein PHN59_05640 [Candidatus Omnitrophica bacterium]|nr:hypothetical protein [Candidatus Omnitrophota bacterium]
MNKKAQGMIEYLLIFCAICTALVASNFLGRMRDNVFGQFFTKATDKIGSLR